MKASKNDRGTYTVRYRDSAGRQREKTFAKKGDALAYGHRAEADRARGVRVDPQAGRITLAKYAEEWMAAQLHRPATADAYQRHLKNHIIPALGSRQLASLRTSEIQGWVRGLTDKGLAPNSVRSVYGVLASILRGAVRDDRISRSPCEGVRLPATAPTGVTILTPDELELLVEKFTPRYRALVVVGFGAGLRQGEAFGLSKDSVRWLERTLVVDKQIVLLPGQGGRPVLAPPKTKASHRIVPLASYVGDALALHMQQYPSDGDLLFVTRNGTALRRHTFNHSALKPALERAGLAKSISFHDLRHSFASLVIKGGATPKEVQSWMGHASIAETFNTYGHLFPDAADNARRFIDEAFAALAPDEKGTIQA